METMIKDVKEKVRGNKNVIRNKINELAEQYAEEYISITLVLDNDEDRKKIQNIKNQYIELFIEEITKVINH